MPDDSTPTPGDRPFWPTPDERGRLLWSAAMVACMVLGIFAPLLLLAPLRLVPGGDTWGLVAVRVGLASAIAALGWLWLTRGLPGYLRRTFAGRVFPTLEVGLAEPPPETSARRAALGSWRLAVMAVVAGLVGAGAIDLESPIFRVDHGPRRVRGLLVILAWIRGNPNTVRAGAWALVAGAVALLVGRVIAARRAKRAAGAGG